MPKRRRHSWIDAEVPVEIIDGVSIAAKPDRDRLNNHGRRANGMLRDWIDERNLESDCEPSPEGERFGCRYEAYLTDPRSERMKTRWRIELAIRLADELP